MSEEIVDEEEELVEVEEETTDEPEEEEEEATEDPYANLTQKEAVTRLKKAESLIIKNKKKTPPAVEKPASDATPNNVEETVLLAQGMDEELLEQLKKVAKVNGTSLIKAQTDDLFVAVKERFEKSKKSAAASLGASKGAGGTKTQKSVSSPGLSREEHMKLAKAATKK